MAMSLGRKATNCSKLAMRVWKAFLILCSVMSGVLFAVVWLNYEQTVIRFTSMHSPLSMANRLGISNDNWRSKLDDHLQQTSVNYDKWLASLSLESVRIPHEQISYGINRSSLMLESEWLANRTRILCLVLATTRSRIRAVNQTWTRHCNERHFYGGFHEKKEPYVKLKFLDDSLLSPRTFCLAFIDLMTRIKHDYDWLLITTDQTFAIVENLRHLVAPLDSRNRFYIGRPVQHYFLGVYNSFESGIVLSRGSVDLLANNLFVGNRTTCIDLSTNGLIYGGQFDSYMGMFLARNGVRPENTYDDSNDIRQSGGTRFHPFMPERHLNPQLISVFDTFWMSNLLPVTGGFGCCSNRAITFTGFSSVTMYFIEYLLYHLAAFSKFDAINGLGNHPPSYLAYQVPSDLDMTTIMSMTTHHNKHHHRKHKRIKHRNKNSINEN
uniref:N-acetylgalactosaminide beta-1,3-galactosyltransferase n=1 Tax=Dermatophagoides pteronyssinus TaxID=6956 RepID=A0A6P6XVY1_DERPT|nr:glycoprotein-N-acetylgalactosamine 3-beta-galactosyltransferase 1-like [Dermatophagoides pteronyssinus]